MSADKPREERIIAAPNDPKLEAAASLARGIVGAIPMAGSALIEAGAYFNPLQKRKRLWELEMTAAVNEITSRLSVLPEELAKDERFISIAYQATLIALKNHQKEKRKALRNFLVTGASETDVDDDLVFHFLRFIDELGVIHLSMLATLDKHAGQFARLKTLESVFEKFRSTYQIRLERVVFRSFLQDLQNRFLVHLGDVEELPELEPSHDVLTAEQTRPRKHLAVTKLGRSFLSFVGDDFTDESA